MFLVSCHSSLMPWANFLYVHLRLRVLLGVHALATPFSIPEVAVTYRTLHYSKLEPLCSASFFCFSSLFSSLLALPTFVRNTSLKFVLRAVRIKITLDSSSHGRTTTPVVSTQPQASSTLKLFHVHACMHACRKGGSGGWESM